MESKTAEVRQLEEQMIVAGEDSGLLCEARARVDELTAEIVRY